MPAVSTASGTFRVHTSPVPDKAGQQVPRIEGDAKKGWKCKEKLEESPEFAISPLHRRMAAAHLHRKMCRQYKSLRTTQIWEKGKQLWHCSVIVSINDDDGYGGVGQRQL